jgi:hypothetical protein
MTIVTYYTNGTPYEQDAMKLVDSVKAAGLNVAAYGREKQEDWVTNCSMKADVCLNALTGLQDDIFWMDADSWVKSWPGVFNDPKFDVACYVEPWQTMSGKKCSIYREWAFKKGGMWTTGVLYLRNIPEVVELVHNWKTICVTNPHQWDQVSLQKAWIAMDNKPRFKALSRTYSCYGPYFGHDSGLKRHWGGRVSSKSSAQQHPKSE